MQPQRDTLLSSLTRVYPGGTQLRTGRLEGGGAGTGHYCGPWRALTVRSNQGLDALPAPLAQPMDHEKQQREDEEGGDAADDQAHPTSHGVKQAAAICEEEEEEEGSRSEKRRLQG